jgi:hypothetical protein
MGPHETPAGTYTLLLFPFFDCCAYMQSRNCVGSAALR